MLYYIRDDQGGLLGFKKDNETYFYQKNIQEDITGIYNKDYELLATYEYDSWGKLLSIKNQNGEEIKDKDHIAYKNPFRYRSYYYDEETKLYYLNSRYYNPEWGRFLNADGIIGTDETTNGYNLFAYCDNNPTNGVDSDGNLAITGCFVAGAVALGALLIGGALVATPQGKSVTRKATSTIENTIEEAGNIVINTIEGIMNSTTSQTKSQAKTITKERIQEKPYQPDNTKIYRYGGANPSNLTPRQNIDYDGLSFMLKPRKKSVTTTIGQINATGILYAFRDKPYHVVVKPANATVKEWMEKGPESIWTQTLKGIVVKWDGKN